MLFLSCEYRAGKKSLFDGRFVPDDKTDTKCVELLAATNEL